MQPNAMPLNFARVAVTRIIVSAFIAMYAYTMTFDNDFQNDGANSKKGPVRQVDVARIAQVSTATVSRVLNGSDLVRPDVRAKVEAAIDTLGYVPNEGARSLVRRRSRTLGAIIPTLNNAIFAAGLNGFEAEARKQGHGLVISVSNYDLEQEAALIRNMVERGVDGLLLVGNDRAPAARQLIESKDFRHVCGWVYNKDSAANVGFDNFAAMEAVVDHLVAGGRRRIAIMGAVTTGNDRARSRVAGITSRLAEHGLEPIATQTLRYSINDARSATSALLASGADAVICGNDVIAYGVLFEAHAKGVIVPDDLAVTGFDDLPMSAVLPVPLTSVVVPADVMGRHAASALLTSLEEERAPTGKQFETQLVVRASTKG